MKKHAIDAVLATQWAITEDALETIRAVAERENEYRGNLEALEAKLGRPLGNTMTASVRDGIALIPVEGTLFKKANFFQAISGATSYATIATDLTKALEDPSVQAVMLMVDSPGGEVAGASEMAAMIAAADKPVWAYGEHLVASAAYWLASAADKLIAAPTAVIGSIGVQMGYTARAPKPGERSVLFVSSQSPLKNADPETEAGAALVKQLVDDQAAVFVADVAANRQVSVDKVLKDFGQGGVMVAEKAMQSGMIDGVSTFESAFAALKQEINSMDWKDVTVASLTEHRPEVVAEIKSAAMASVEPVDAGKIRAEAVAAERQRIAGIEALALPGTEELVAKFKADGTEPATAAVEILKAVKAGGLDKPSDAAADKGRQHLAGLQDTEKKLDPPAAGSGSDGDDDDINAAASAAVASARKLGIAA